MSYLTAWGLLESQKSKIKKKCKNVQIGRNSLAFHSEKDLN